MSEELSMQCAVTANNGERVPVKIVSTATPTQVRQLVSEATGIPLSALRLIFRGKMIKDDDSKNAVQEYSLKEGEVLHCMGKPGGAAAAAAPAPPTSTTTPTASTTAGAAPTLSAANTSASAASAPVSLATPTGASGLQAALAKLRTSNPPATYLTAIQTLEKILSNIANNPMEEKYRRMKKSNGAFQKRLGGVPGGADCLLAAGFVSEMKDGEDCFVLQASADAWPQLMASKTAVEAAVQQAKTSAAPPASAAAVPPVNPMGLGGMPGSGFGGMPGGMGAGMPGMNSPQMQQAMRNMMSNPDQLRIMLQVSAWFMISMLIVDCIFYVNSVPTYHMSLP
jgi:hypothetical protein